MGKKAQPVQFDPKDRSEICKEKVTMAPSPFKEGGGGGNVVRPRAGRPSGGELGMVIGHRPQAQSGEGQPAREHQPSNQPTNQVDHGPFKGGGGGRCKAEGRTTIWRRARHGDG